MFDKLLRRPWAKDMPEETLELHAKAMVEAHKPKTMNQAWWGR